MEASGVRVERTPGRGRTLWPPLRRRHDVAITLPLRTAEDLFNDPGVDPFSPGYERYGDRPGIDVISGVLRVERPVSSVHTTVELAAGFDEAPGAQAADALRRYCHVKIADLEQELREIRRYGAWALVLGFLVVLVLNAIARPLDSSDDNTLQSISLGLQAASWVVLWLPVNLLVYDRWYARRDQTIYREILEMDVSVVPGRDRPSGS
jgi:hypothetical protein